MQLPTSALKTCYSSLALEVLLQRLANRTAVVIASTDGLSSSRRSQPFHEFEGTVANNYFAIRRLPSDSLGLHSYQVISPVQAPEVEGWLRTQPTGGTHIQLRYQAARIKWWWALLSLVLLAWAKGGFLLTWPTASQVGQALAAIVFLLLASWIAQPVFLWLMMRELHPRLVELFGPAVDAAT